MPSPVDLAFAHKYDADHAQQYLHKQRGGFLRHLSQWRDEQLARHALALVGDPGLVLDLPCGTGHFWPLLAAKSYRVIIGADSSADMLKLAFAAQAPDIVKRVQPLQTSAFVIDLPDNSVDSIFCMHLLHHVGDSAHRLMLLRECQRVTRDSLIVSLCVDGNFKAWRRKRMERRHSPDPSQENHQNRFVLPAATVEAELRQAGFRVRERLDFLPFYAMWRVYVLHKVDL